MRASKVRGVECPHCNTPITTEDDVNMVQIRVKVTFTDAIGHDKTVTNATALIANEDFWQCGECGEVHVERDNARDCCK